MRDDHTWIQTYTGRQYWPLEPRSADVAIMDIAHHLAHICRYTGAVLNFYSVAQHSVLVSLNVPPADALWGLLHDASEAYIADVARPLKHSPAFVAYREIEKANMLAISRYFGLQDQEPPSIGLADRVLLATERRDLMREPPRPWLSTERVEPLRDRIRALSPVQAEESFLLRYRKITEGF